MPLTLAPDDVVATHEQAAGNEREPLLVLEPLRAFLHDQGLEAPADLSAEPVGEGHSNVTFALSTGVVLRRPPRGTAAAQRARRAPGGAPAVGPGTHRRAHPPDPGGVR